ncbi:MAG: S46 family peptidase [Bacteroidaceae bacterium]|nr:S46 family peptidase [Bacteroidaceae bacterium]
MKKMLLLALLLMATVARADEGMWMLNRIDDRTARIMKELGLQLTPRQLYNPEGVSLKDAVVDFGDFCSGVVVSRDGLVFTNHHCGYSAIQQLSTPERDILKNGFVARSHEEELPAEGLFVRFLDRTEDCTSRVMRAMNGLSNDKLDSVMSAVEQEYTAANPGKYCLVKSYYTGNAFYASIYTTYTDIRLVFTATETVGKFGGDTDNWMWPRQTCDFSVFRIYADKDGQPADYSKDNQPLTPKHFVRVSTAGYQPGDYCMTVGFPGSTDRYLSSFGIHERTEAINAAMIDVRGKKQDVWKRWMKDDRSVAIKYAAKFAQSSNYWKNSIGMNKAVQDLDVIGEKETIEQNILHWMADDASLQNRFGDMLPQLKADYANRFDAVRAMMFFNETFMRGAELYRAVQPGFDDKDYVREMDEEVLATLADNYRQQVPARYLPDFYSVIDRDYQGDCKAYAKAVFADSTLSAAYVEAVDAKMKALRADITAASKRINYNEHLLTQALLEMEQEAAHYSDANFSMRLSYGYIQDYTSQGNHFDYYTASASLLEKAARQDEVADYKLEADIVELMKRGDFGRYADKRTGDLHLCFLSNNDITGGNSGSPMFNGKGELIGLAFDGNWEAMAGDISFDPDLQRCIGVDIRYVLFLIEKWGHADHLIREVLGE